MIFELMTIKYCMNELQKRKKENFTRYTDDNTNTTKNTNTTIMLVVLVISILSLILAIWGIVDAVTHCKQEDKVVGVILALFIWPLYWILRLSGAFCKK